MNHRLALRRGAGAQPLSPAADKAAKPTTVNAARQSVFHRQPADLPVPAVRQDQGQRFLAGLRKGMAEQKAEVEAIANSRDKPTFDNTIVALERPVCC